MSSNKLNEIQNRIAELRKEQQELEEESLKLLEAEGGEGTYAIRPAGRHVLTIGEDLIQDHCAAIIELVKNSYDADSEDVSIVFSKDEETNIVISIIDHGCGMSTEDVVNKWLVPSTKNKLENRISPNGRIMQGRKGIGRYAASILGDKFYMKTVDKNGICNEIQICWDDFMEAEYLDQAGVKLSTHKTDDSKGTSISITVRNKDKEYWSDDRLVSLKDELKRMLSMDEKNTDQNPFEIFLTFKNFYDDDLKNTSEEIKPFPIFELYDYRISGEIDRDGKGILLYETQKIKPASSERIHFNYGEETKCGKLVFDIRVYDRDGDAIDEIIHRGNGLKRAGSDKYMTRLEARRLLNTVNGIGVYRNGFRIRPLGDPDYDWLKLNKLRIQNPSRKIGSDQVTGVVSIESEELSSLEEKSARDGLKENLAYNNLRDITAKVISIVEEKRYLLRRQLGITKSKQKIERQLDSLYDYSDLKNNVAKTLGEAGIAQDTIEKIGSFIEEEEGKNNATIDEIKKAIAQYQGQATLGKIISIVVHEGRRPLLFFKDQTKNMIFAKDEFLLNNTEDNLREIVELAEGFADNGQIFVNQFSRLDPLASKRKDRKKAFLIKPVIEKSIKVFENMLNENGIICELSCDKDLMYEGWDQDFYAILVNLIDNSIYWMIEAKTGIKKINISVEEDQQGKVVIDYKDSGPGISKELLDSGVIFDPEFSTKQGGGSGLGLAIAGESAERNKLQLEAVEDESGAHFILRSKEEESDV